MAAPQLLRFQLVGKLVHPVEIDFGPEAERVGPGAELRAIPLAYDPSEAPQ
jgi:hypothetical protein